LRAPLAGDGLAAAAIQARDFRARKFGGPSWRGEGGGVWPAPRADLPRPPVAIRGQDALRPGFSGQGPLRCHPHPFGARLRLRSACGFRWLPWPRQASRHRAHGDR